MSLKQSNKSFKSKHSSKRNVDRSNHRRHGGRTEAPTRKNVRQLSTKTRQDRRNEAKQAVKNKRQKMAAERRTGGEDGAPKIVALIAMSAGANVREARNALLSGADEDVPHDHVGPVTVRYTNLKQRFTFLEVSRDSMEVLDACKVADVVMYVFSAAEHPDSVGEFHLTLIKAQGVPGVIGGLQGLHMIAAKHQGNRVKELVKYLQGHFAVSDIKVVSVDEPAKMPTTLRTLSLVKLRQLHFRCTRPYLLVDKVDFNQTSEEAGTLRVGGYLRGGGLSPNQLVHLPGVGTFQLEQIFKAPDPCPLKKHHGEEATDLLLLEAADKVMQEDLVEFFVPEDEEMEADQAWANEVDDGFKRPQRVVKRKVVPKGMSEYQAAWISASYSSGSGEADEEGRQEDGASDDGEPAPMDAATWKDGGAVFPGQNLDTISDVSSVTSGGDSDDGLDPHAYDMKYGAVSDGDAAIKAEMTMEQLEQDDITWPDEVDTPQDRPARDVFREYRGLKNFAHSTWDPQENLPPEYRRIFRFENFARTSRHVLQDAAMQGVNPDMYIAVDIHNVPAAAFATLRPESPIVLFGLFKYEHKMSVVHYAIQRHTAYDDPVPAATPMILQVGFRRFRASPLYSDNSKKGSKNRMHNFLHRNAFAIASIYGPITFGQAPVLMFKDGTSPDNVQLVANGSTHAIDPDRLIIRRVIISGDCAKIRKKKATVRRMFWSSDDVRWFKKVQLFTKYGRHGHIRKPLGLHGHFKAIFDGVVMSQDTVCMALYKRVYPPWNTELITAANNPFKGD